MLAREAEHDMETARLGDMGRQPLDDGCDDALALRVLLAVRDVCAASGLLVNALALRVTRRQRSTTTGRHVPVADAHVHVHGADATRPLRTSHVATPPRRRRACCPSTMATCRRARAAGADTRTRPAATVLWRHVPY